MKNFTQPVSKDLLASVANGDEAAFSSLFNQYKQLIYSYAFHFTHSAFYAEEITQEVFMKTWINREQLAEIENFDAWIKTVTRNSSFNYLKKIANELRLKKSVSESDTEATDNIDEYIFEKENQYLLARALETLSPQQRLIFKLNREKGLKNHEIAEQLNLSPNTVKTHMVSALSRIREYFEAHPISIIILLASGRYIS